MDKLILLPALRIALIYFILAVLWIALSDQAAAYLVDDSATLTAVQTWKGWAFVATTAALLGLLVQKEIERYARTRHDLDQARAAQLASEDRYHRMFAESPLPSWVYEAASGRILAVNDAALRHYGYRREEWLRLATTDLGPVPPPSQEGGDDESASRRLWRHARRDGSSMDMEIVTHAMEFEGCQACMVIAQDVTERRRSEERIYRLAYFDGLTGLPNRALLIERLREAIETARRDRLGVILIFFDLDRFKDINDSLGHRAGDALLKEVGSRLVRTLPPGGTVARMSADLYALLLTGRVNGDDARRLADAALASLSGPIDLGSVCMVETTACAGIALFPDHAEDDGTLMRNAEAALHHAIAQGRNQRAVYQAEMNLRSLERLALENDLRLGLEQGHFVVHYQPQLSMENRVSGVEALVRWHHPEQGLLPPGRFIPLAEESGLIVPLGAWVLREACRQAGAWFRDGIPVTVAVNLSAIQFHQPRLVEHVAGLLEEAALPPRYLELEVTESIIMGDTAEVTATLDSLRAMGLQISIDDFGTGYSSLAYLGRMAVTKLKIDQSFVRGIPDKEDARAITSTIITLAKNLRLTVIAEGVETQSQADFLRREGCDEMQGYLYSRPLPAAEAESFIRDHGAH